MRLAWYLLTNWHNICLHVYIFNLVDRMARSTVHKLIKKTKTTTMESLKGQYKHIEAIMTGKRLYKEVKAKHNLIETGLRNEIDCDTMDQNCYDELYMTPNIEKSIPGKHASEMSFTLKDDSGVKLSANGSSHEQTPFHASCLSGDVDSVREILNKQKDCEGSIALMLAVSGGHKDLVRVLIEEFQFSINTSENGKTLLHEACIKGHTDLVRELIVEHGADLSAKDNNKNDALMYAVSGGHQDLVRILIKEFQFSANTCRGRTGSTPLLEACLKGHTDLVRELVVEHGADLSAKDNYSDDALMCAVTGGHQDLVRILIKEFNFNANTSQGSIPLHQACINGHTELVRQLVVEHGVDINAKDNRNDDALMFAVAGGHQELVRVLINEFDFNVNMNRGRSERTPVVVACYNGHTDLMRQLVVEHRADLGAKDIYSRDALLYAVAGGHQDLVRVLINEFDFNVNMSQGGNGRTPLLEACFFDHTDIVRQLVVEHGADLTAKDNNNDDALMCAVTGGHQELVRVLINEFDFNANMSRRRNGRTPLHEACLKGHTDLVRELVVEHGADLSAKDNNNNDALMYAVIGGHQDLVRILIKEFQFSANTCRGRTGSTPLLWACFEGHTDLVRELVVEHGADLSAKDNYSVDALMYAVIGGHQDLVRILIKEFNFNANTSQGSIPLHQACINGHTELVRQLVVEHGVDINAKDNRNDDALMFAVTGGHQELVRVLINEFDFNVNMNRGRSERTPVVVACYKGHTDLMRQLVVEHRADLGAKDIYSRDALLYAVAGGHQDLVRVLINEFDFNVNMSQGGNGRTPLLEACFFDHTDIVRQLVIEHGADLTAKDNDNDDALMFAVIGGHQHLVRVLIKEFHFNANMSRGSNGRTPLLEACLKGHTDLVRELVVEHGADLSAKDNNNNDALMYAVIGGHQHLVRVLIKEFHFNANMSRGSKGRTPLLEACCQGRIDIVRQLVVEHGADLSAKDNKNNDALMLAVFGGHQVLVRILIKEFHFCANTSRGINGRTPLLEACLRGHIDLVKDLVIEHGADLSAKDNNNNDALMLAVIGGHQDLVRVLIKEYNFYANTSRGSDGRTPLLEACYQGHIDLVRQLVVEHGADLSAKDNNNYDSLLFAVSGSHKDLVRILIKEFISVLIQVEE